ncbi:hypothetical protein PCYB_073100 [Plasmodium cynomolgi strain B]|uniref:Uncharacterized protein n=1 Tax=Plasmodium cynomolgi (strain B) TaxID=1120755 RepID=K6UJC6_PLACD|nr:hypothetical protein PCYB_073100 [Plasmodium cynomolgi strain B]GAB65808.1 hypothetical protein PCYB_073100 [Plasmodium cynomolgi strain B]
MELNDKRNGEKHQLSTGTLEEDGNELVGEKGNTNKRIYMTYHEEGENYKDEEKEDGGGVPHKRNRRPSITSPSIDDHVVDKGEEYHLAKKKKKAKVVNELSSPALSPNGGENNPVSDGDDRDSYYGDRYQGEGNKWKNNRGGDHHHASEKKAYNIRKMAQYASHIDTSPGEKRNLCSDSIPSSEEEDVTHEEKQLFSFECGNIGKEFYRQREKKLSGWEVCQGGEGELSAGG